jgi:hypothetical protein
MINLFSLIYHVLGDLFQGIKVFFVGNQFHWRVLTIPNLNPKLAVLDFFLHNYRALVLILLGFRYQRFSSFDTRSMAARLWELYAHQTIELLRQCLTLVTHCRDSG